MRRPDQAPGEFSPYHLEVRDGEVAHMAHHDAEVGRERTKNAMAREVSFRGNLFLFTSVCLFVCPGPVLGKSCVYVYLMCKQNRATQTQHETLLLWCVSVACLCGP